MKTKWWAILLMLPCTVFISTGQIFYKFGVEDITFELSSELIYSTVFNLPLIIGLVSYGIGLFILILAFRGGELSVLYPMVATSYIWVSLASSYIFPTDSMNISKWIGVILIIAGVSVIGWGREK